MRLATCWWPAVYLDAGEVRSGDEHGLGQEFWARVKGWLPYTLRLHFRTVESRYPYGSTLESTGDLEGTGIWTFEQDGPWVNVTFEWRIRAGKAVIRRLSFLVKPLFESNHHWCMRQGEESLRLELARRLARTPEARALVPPPPGPIGTLPYALAGVAALAVAGGLAYALRRASPGRRFHFNPDRLAYFEAAGWRAYYDRDWLKLLRLLVATSQEQFHIPFPRSLQAAYYAARGAIAWAPLRHDARLARRYYDQFYRLARRYSGLRFDPQRVADLEMRYWDVHRRLSGQPDKSAFVRTMTDLHSAIFGIPAAAARESAEWRVRAADVVDRITSRVSTDVEGDWRRLEEYLRRCYRSIQRELRTTTA